MISALKNPVKEFGWSGKVLDDFLDMTEVRTPAPGVPIQCPTNVGSTKVYEWFVANRTVEGTGTAPKIDQVLRELEDEGQKPGGHRR